MKQLLFWILLTIIPVFASQPKPSTRQQKETMTKVVLRSVFPSLPTNSFARKPMTHYRVGSHFSRTEEAFDKALNLKGLIIMNMRDSWMINLATKTGKHIVDHGKTFDIYMPLLPVNSDSKLNRFEIGNEIQFLKEQNAKEKKTVKNGKECIGFTLYLEGFHIKLIANSNPVKPYELRAYKNGKLVSAYQYVEHQINLPINKSLFECPNNIKITEVD